MEGAGVSHHAFGTGTMMPPFSQGIASGVNQIVSIVPA